MRRDRLDTTAIAIMTLCCALWGVQQVTVKLAVADGLPPVLQSALRSAGAAVLGAAWLLARQGPGALREAVMPRTGLWPRVVLALLFAAEFVAMFAGIGLTSASRAVLFVYSAPFFTALGAQLFLPQERMGMAQALGLVIAFAGVAAAFTDGLLHGHGSFAGDALCALGAILWAATSILVKASPPLYRTSASALLLFQLGGSVPLLFAASALLGEWSAPMHVGAVAWAALAYQTVIVAFASYLVWYWLLLTYPAWRVAGFTFLTPVFGVAAGGLILGEPLSWGLLAGLVAIAVGLRLINRPAKVPATA
jgi:drug/metabolite transporter (DMT)-like permease